MSTTVKRTTQVLIATVGLIALVACAINPATGKRQLSLIGEDQEVEIGREQDRLVVESIGLYGGPRLQSYVQGVGARLAAGSERPDLPWTFRVVDDPNVNAFALPGGFIYVTRGIVTHLTNEAELAAVLAHEIGHVTARHSVNQMSKSELASMGLAIGSAVSSDFAKVGGAVESGLGLLFLKYSRDDESQADGLGLRYVVNQNYDPRQMSNVFDVLDRLSQTSGAGSVPGWLATHPAPANRRQAIDQAIVAMNPNPAGSVVNQPAYYSEIDKMVFGEDPREGFFSGTRFLHPELRFVLEFPQGYQTANQKSAVLGISAGQDAMVELSLSGATTADAGLRDFLAQEGMRRAGNGVGRVHGMPTASDAFSVTGQGGAVRGVVAFVQYDGRVFRLLGYATEAAWSQREAALRASLSSFDRLTDPAALQVQAKQLNIVRPPNSLSVNSFASSYDATIGVATLALINQVETTAQLQGGKPYKVVTGGTYSPTGDIPEVAGR